MTISRLMQMAAANTDTTGYDLTQAATDVPFFSVQSYIDISEEYSGGGTEEDHHMRAFRWYDSGRELFVLMEDGYIHRFRLSTGYDFTTMYSHIYRDIKTLAIDNAMLSSSSDYPVDFRFINTDEVHNTLIVLFDSGASDNRLVEYYFTNSYDIADSTPFVGRYIDSTYTTDASCFDTRVTANNLDGSKEHEIFIREESANKIYTLSFDTYSYGGIDLTSFALVNSSGTYSGSGFANFQWYSMDMHGDRINFIEYDYSSSYSTYVTFIKTGTLSTLYDVSTLSISSTDYDFQPPVFGWQYYPDSYYWSDVAFDKYKNKYLSCIDGLYVGSLDIQLIFKFTGSSFDVSTWSFTRAEDNYTIMEGLGSGLIHYAVGDIHVTDNADYLYFLDCPSPNTRYIHKVNLGASDSLSNITASSGTISVSYVKTQSLSFFGVFGSTSIVGGVSLSPDQTKIALVEGYEIDSTVTYATYQLASAGDLSISPTLISTYNISDVTSLDAYRPTSCVMSRDGLQFFVLYIDKTSSSYGNQIQRPKIRQLTLTTPWDLSTATQTDLETLSTNFANSGSNAIYFRAEGMAFNPTGTRLFVSGIMDNQYIIVEYQLKNTLGADTPWDMTNMQDYSTVHDFTDYQNGHISSIGFNLNGTRLFTGSPFSSTLTKYDIGS
jgi:hypothetical protein